MNSRIVNSPSIQDSLIRGWLYEYRTVLLLRYNLGVASKQRLLFTIQAIFKGLPPVAIEDVVLAHEDDVKKQRLHFVSLTEGQVISR